jgi:hypothetical protein
MFRIKDHIISLVAVFLALGLGILIGTGMSDDMLITQQRLLIEQMTKDYREMRAEQQEMEARLLMHARDLSLWEKYQEALYPGIVSGALEGKRITVVSYATDIPDGVLSLLHDAEAGICNVIHIEGRTSTGTEAAGLGASVAALAAGEPLTPDVTEIISSYISENKVRVEQYAADRPDAIILFLGGRQSADRKLVSELVNAFSKGQYSVVGLENSDITDSLLQEVKAAGFSTIDNADTVFGQFSLLSVLRGSAGSYGIKSAADQFMATF